MTLEKLKTQINMDIDFRKDVHIVNQYGMAPTMEYNRAVTILKEARKILAENYRDYIIYNSLMDTELLKISTLKEILTGWIFDYKQSYFKGV